MEDGAITLWNAKKCIENYQQMTAANQDPSTAMGRGCISAAQIHDKCAETLRIQPGISQAYDHGGWLLFQHLLAVSRRLVARALA